MANRIQSLNYTPEEPPPLLSSSSYRCSLILFALFFFTLSLLSPPHLHIFYCFAFSLHLLTLLLNNALLHLHLSFSYCSFHSLLAVMIIFFSSLTLSITSSLVSLTKKYTINMQSDLHVRNTYKNVEKCSFLQCGCALTRSQACFSLFYFVCLFVSQWHWFDPCREMFFIAPLP